MSDEEWMKIALDEAAKGVGKTAPNPCVGAVIVKAGILLGKGYHHRAGLPHAEREALAAAIRLHGAPAVRGATAYVTLEPCSSFGRTPPCVDGLIEAGIARVVYACEDPNPAHAGRADALLAQAGVVVEKGVCEKEARHLLRAFAKVQRCGLPWVIVKWGMSLDGRITRPAGEGAWLTNEQSRADVQQLRAEVEMILTSGETVRQDLPALTIRDSSLCEGREQPWRLVLSRQADRLPLHAPLFTDAHAQRTLVRAGDLTEILRHVVIEQGVLTVLVEAGGTLVAELLQANLVDEIVGYMAPMITGGLPAVAGNRMPEFHLHNVVWTRIGDDMKFRALVQPRTPIHSADG